MLKPDLVAELTLLPAEESARSLPLPPGYSCPCFSSRDRRENGWDARLLLEDESMALGETRTIGFVFLSGQEAVEALSTKPTFFLWDGGIIGEARVVEPSALS